MAQSEAPAAPRVELYAWTRVIDYSGHGSNASGVGYRRAGDGWESAHCTSSSVADPEANSPNRGPQCEAWSPVPNAQWPALDDLRAHQVSDVTCSERAEVCSRLGLTAQTRSR